MLRAGGLLAGARNSSPTRRERALAEAILAVLPARPPERLSVNADARQLRRKEGLAVGRPAVRSASAWAHQFETTNAPPRIIRAQLARWLADAARAACRAPNLSLACKRRAALASLAKYEEEVHPLPPDYLLGLRIADKVAISASAELERLDEDCPRVAAWGKRVRAMRSRRRARPGLTGAAASAPVVPDRRHEVTPSRRSEPSHGPEFEWVEEGGRVYEFAKPQERAVVKVLWEHRERRGHGMHEEAIGEAIGARGDRFRLDHVFRGKNRRMNRAWGLLVKKVSPRVYRLGG